MIVGKPKPPNESISLGGFYMQLWKFLNRFVCDYRLLEIRFQERRNDERRFDGDMIVL